MQGRLAARYNAASDAGWSSQVARRAHNPEVAGSNPAPAMSKGPVTRGLSYFAGQGAPATATARPRRSGARPRQPPSPVVAGAGWVDGTSPSIVTRQAVRVSGW